MAIGRIISCRRWQFVGLIVLLATVAGADTIGVDQLVIFSEDGKVTIDQDTVVYGDMAAKKQFEISQGVRTGSIFTEDSVDLDRDVIVRGRILANDDVSIDRNLDFEGSDITGDEVEIGRNATITGDVRARDDLEIERDSTVHGSLLGNSRITINDNTAVYGDASPGPGDSLILGSGVTVTGSTTPSSKIIPTFTLPEMPSEPSKPSFGNNNVQGSAESDIDLDPGSYKDLAISRDSVLTLHSGTYTFKSFWMDKRGIVNIDTSEGDVVINVHKGFDTGQYVQFNPTGTGRVIINVYGTDGMSLGQSNVMRATVQIWKGAFGADQNFDLIGSVLAAGNIAVAQGASLFFSRGDGGYISAPEPSTLLVLAAGALLTLRRRRRHVRA